MENNTFNISEIYVGKVVSVHLDTHELEVYLPKLMPTLNYGFSETIYNVDLQSEVIKTNTLLCMPTDFKERVPKEGSLTKVYFIDGDIKKMYWIDFDPFGTNTYIEFEKVGNEKTLEDFANMFDVSATSLMPKDIGVMLGSSAKPFFEIFGNISSEYVVGLDEKLKKIADDIAKNISVSAADINLTTLKEITVVNDSTGDTPLTIDGIESTTAALANFKVNGETKVSVESDGNINATSITLKDAPGPLSWGTESGTLEIPMGNGVVQQIGEELYYTKVINKTGVTIPNGTPVRSDGIFGEYTIIVPMIADNTVDRFLFMGLLTQTLENEQTGRVTYFGKVGDIDTSPYVSGTPLYVSSTAIGMLTDEKPISPNYAIPVGVVRKVGTTDGSINVRYTYLPKASEVTYDHSESELSATNLQAAVDELQATKASIAALSSNITLYPTSADSDIVGYKKMVRSTLDVDYDSTSIDIPTGVISGTGQLLASLASAESIIVGNPGLVNITTLGNIKKTAGNSQQYGEFYFEIYLRNQSGVETLIGTSNTTGAVNPYDAAYYQFSATAILNNSEWTETDRMIIKYYANMLGISGSEYVFQFGGNTPIRTLIPVPVEVIPSDVASDILVDTSTFNKILTSAETNVQKALEKLDDHEHNDLYIAKLNGTGTELTLNNNTIGDTPLSINAITGTTANLQEWKINNSILAYITSLGNYVGNGAILNNVRIAVAGDNEIDTASGNLTIDSAGGTTTVDDNLSVSGNLVVNGDLTVQGTNTILNTTTVSTEDDLIVLRSAATAGTPMTSYAGLVTKYYDGVNSGALVYDNAGILKIGDVTLNGDGTITNVSMQTVATREDSTTLNAIPYWDAAGTGKLLSSDIKTDPLTGNIGIGIDPNTYKLRVGGTGFFTSTLAATLFQDSSNGSYYLDPANTGTSLNVAGDAILGNRLFAKTLYLWSDTSGSYITNEIGTNTTAIKLQTKSNQPISLSSGTGGVGIGTDTPSAQLEVKSSLVAKVPLVVDTLISQTANLQEWKVNGVAQSWIENDGSFRVGEVRNKTTINNSKISLSNTGTQISRNTADANPALTINQINSSSTGNIADFLFNNVSRAFITNTGRFRTNDGMSNAGSTDYAYVNTTQTGTAITRNIADENSALKVQLSHTDSAGNIQEWYSNISGTTALRARLDKTGSFYTNDLVVSGNLTVEGTNTILNTSTVTTEDDLIVLRSAGTVGVPMLSYAGLVAKYYDGTNSGALVFDNTGTAFVGDVTLNGDGTITNVSMQPLVTRSTLNDGYLPYWESSTNSLTNSNTFYDSATGRIGIGTATPGVTLDVNGAIRSTGVFYGSSFTNGSGETYAMIGDDLVLTAGGVERARVLGSNGNIGIGTPTPGQKLHTYGSGVIKNTIQSTDNQVQLELSGTLGQIFNTNGPLYITNNDSNDDIIFRAAASSEKMRLTAAGNLGVGVVSPSGQLEVKASTTDKVPMIIDSLTAQTANLQEWKVNGTTLAYLDKDGRVVAADIKVASEGKTLDNIIDFWDNITGGFRLFGGVITSNGNGTVAITAGGGLSKAENAGPEDVPTALNQGQGSKTAYVSWNAIPSLTLTDNAYNFIYYEGTTGLVKATTDFYSISFTRDFIFGRAFRMGNEVIARLCGTNAWNFNRRVQLFGEETFPVVRSKGVKPGFSQRYITFTSGILWAELVNRFSVNAFTTVPPSAQTFNYWYRDGVGGWIRSTGNTQLNNTLFDDGDGTLGTLLANRYGVHWLYVVHDGSAHIVYGQGNYTLAEAELATPPATKPAILDAYATLVGKYIIQKDSATILTVEEPNMVSFTPTTVTSHNDLGGIQGGTAGQYYHLTSAEYSTVQNFTGTGTLTDITVRNSAEAIKPITVLGLLGTTANLQEWQLNPASPTTVASVNATGDFSGRYGFFTSGVANASSVNNARVDLNTTGTVIQRNIADANDALTINQAHASSTGLILDAQASGTTKASIEKDGSINTTSMFKYGSSAYTVYNTVDKSIDFVFTN